METKFKSIKAQNKTIRNKVAAPKSIRAVLATPHKKINIEVGLESQNEVTDIMKNLFGTASPTVKIPYKDIKSIPKDQRKEFRKKFNIEESIQSKHNCFVTGINQIIRKLESKDLEALIVSSDLNNNAQILNDNLIRLCVTNKIPIISLPNLRNQLKVSLNGNHTAVAFKSDQTCQNFSILINKIRDLSKINCERTEIEVVKTVSGAAKTEETGEDKAMEVSNNEEPVYKNLYLFRDENSTTRRFICSSQEETVDIKKEDNFMSLSVFGESESKFLPAVVKRIRSNNKRSKK